MNQNWLVRVLAGLMLTMSSTIVFAADENADEAKQTSSSPIVVLDGEGKVLLGGGILDSLPKGVRDQLKQFRVEFGRPMDSDIEVKVEGLNVTKPTDQPNSEAAEMKLSISSKGTVVVVGPDGKTTRREFTFGGNGDGKNGAEADLIGKIMTEVLDGEHGLPTDTVQRVTHFFNSTRPGRKAREAASDQDAIIEKLDAILGRLDRLESELAELKKAN